MKKLGKHLKTECLLSVLNLLVLDVVFAISSVDDSKDDSSDTDDLHDEDVITNNLSKG